MEEEFYWLWICNIRGVGSGTIEKMLEVFLTPEAIYRTDYRELEQKLKQTGIRADIIQCVHKSKNYDSIRKLQEKLYKKKIRFIDIKHREYPEKLKSIKGYPYGIYLKGRQMNLKRPIVAVVGARNCTGYGRKYAHDISFELAANGVDIISGLARGIDSEGHWGALDAGGMTYAVMGCGVDVCYPRENIELYERILNNGSILSDYPVGTQPVGWQFPLRNRLISALADRILVVEAREKSGSLITVEYGLEQGKDIFALPGRVDDIMSRGCNRLIKEGAGVATSAEDILYDLGIRQIHNSKKNKNKNFILEKDLETLYSYLDFLPKSIQTLVNETGRDSVEIFRDLVKLQMMGLADEPSKNYYSKKT